MNYPTDPGEVSAMMEQAVEVANVDNDGYSQIIRFSDNSVLFVAGDKMMDINRREYQFKLAGDWAERTATPLEVAIHAQLFGS